MASRVSDHALVRYMERVLGVDVEALRQEIADATVRHGGAPSVRIGGARFLLIDGRVVTAIPGDTVPRFDVLVRFQREGRK